MKKPIIGIVTTVGPDPGAPDERDVFYVGKPYVDAILAAGGAPILIPHGTDPESIIDFMDGWMIIGGRDIDPVFYGQDPHPSLELEVRDRFECERNIYVRAADSMPVLGICYGCQFLNLVRGGDLVQHLPDVVGDDSHSGGTMQAYEVAAGSQLATAVGKSQIEGKSYHHQAIGSVGYGFTTVAKAADGTIEGIEDTEGRWIVGVQWHPERTPDDPASQNLFREFVSQAARYQLEKVSCGTW